MEAKVFLQLLNLASPLLVLTQDGRIIYLNQAAQSLFNTTEQLAHNGLFTEFLADADFWKKTMCPEIETWEGEVKASVQGKDLTLMVKLNRALTEGVAVFLVSCEDISEKKQMQEYLQRAQRIEGNGFLVTGAAHDMNNVLLLFMMLVRVLRGRLLDAHSQQLFTMVEAGSKRGSALLKQMLNHARGIEKKHVEIALEPLIEELVALSKETFSSTVHIKTSYVGQVAPIWGNLEQLHQVFLNLMINARDAVEPGGGTISITLETQDLDSTDHHHRFLSGLYTIIKISDTGAGMSQDVMDRMYEPYFTTKPEGKGTGIGLPTVMNITKGHNGIIDVSSELGKGTTFTVYFPAISMPFPVQ